MGFVYHNLAERRRPRGSGLPSRAFVIVKRVAVKVVGIICSGRRRPAKRVTWSGLFWARLRKVAGLPPTSGGGRRKGQPAAVYDLDSYARNFDDGVWKEEEDEYWRSGSFAYRFGQSVRLIST